MKKKYFNKRSTQRAKANIKKVTGRKRLMPKRLGGVLGASVIMENRNFNASGLANEKKEIL